MAMVVFVMLIPCSLYEMQKMKCRPNDKEEVEKNQYCSVRAVNKNVGRRFIVLMARCSVFFDGHWPCNKIFYNQHKSFTVIYET